MKRRTRQTISEAAQKLFPTGGYGRTSIELIAAEAQVTKITIYRHFENKEALFSEETDADSHLRAAMDAFLLACGSGHAPGSMSGTKGALVPTNVPFIGLTPAAG